MNPKISDFGMARMFMEDQVQGKTTRVVGTYGYMSPEYAIHGQYSIKSDVFSYGVLTLEIISGRKNSDYGEKEPWLNLIGHVWDLWREEKALPSKLYIYTWFFFFVLKRRNFLCVVFYFFICFLR
ncbi:hypothetical protein POPTR_004G028350v4 [Populus trichocarpa]|uniref:Uncharacterized protein n=1 Tax=Populus trichocarpa TaxID=3694 RepID=A0ACC0T2R4_POPTR|nr:hypothetical protein POPTR_004G028350v4 [Populus trichocarpa]